MVRVEHALGERLEALARRGLDKGDEVLRSHLLVAAYQLLVLDRIPAFAAINEAVAALRQRRGAKVAGFANFYQWQHGEFCALGNMMVAFWARGHGVAQFLIEAMERQAREQYKARLMKVSCFNANAAGLLLYTRLGYQPRAIVERLSPEGRRIALIQLDKPLTD